MKHRVRENKKGRASTQAKERKEKRAKRKVYSLERMRVFLSLCFLFLQGAEKKLVNTKPPELPSLQSIKQPFIPKWSYKEHHEFEFEPGDWVRVPGEHYNSDLRSNPFEEEENDATLVSKQSTVLDLGDVREEVQDERVENKAQACYSAREKSEAIESSN